MTSIARQPAYLAGPTAVKWRIVLPCLVLGGAYYAFLISFGFSNFFGHSLYGLTFNSMLEHLLHGAFDVDPQTIGSEGVIHDGKVFSYYGIFPALLRLPFVLSPDFASTDYTRLSCVVATCVMAGAKLASVLTVWQTVGRPERSTLPTLFCITILLGGPQVQFLHPMIYQEVSLWAAALGAAFVYLVIRGCYSQRGFDGGTLAALAVLAGLCLQTRVPTALGLYIALGLLWLQQAWQALGAAGYGRLPRGFLARFLPSIAVLGMFVVIAGMVNYGRWGNPLTFTDPQNYIWAKLYGPDRLIRDAEYGMFNLVRLGYGLVYYFVPVWVVPTTDGSLLWSAFQHRTIDSVELPPSSFFISDPLTVGLAIYALVGLARSRTLHRAVAVPVLVGLFIPIVLMLTWLSMTFRYRLDFYPFLDFCSFLGFGALLSRPEAPPRRAFALAAIAQQVAAPVLWFVYALSPLGDADRALGSLNVISYYLARLHGP